MKSFDEKFPSSLCEYLKKYARSDILLSRICGSGPRESQKTICVRPHHVHTVIIRSTSTATCWYYCSSNIYSENLFVQTFDQNIVFLIA